MRQQGRLLLRLEALEGFRAEPEPDGLPVGAVAPESALADSTGERRTLAGLRAMGPPVMLVFTSRNCPPCRALLPALAQWRGEWHDVLTVAVITDAPPGEGWAAAAEPVLPLLVDEDDAVSRMYSVGATPSAVIIGPDGAVQSSFVAGGDAIRRVADEIVAVGERSGRPSGPAGSRGDASGEASNVAQVLTGVVDGQGQ